MKYLNLGLPEPARLELFRRIEQIFVTGRYILGDEVKKFEDKVTDCCAGAHCVSVNSGYDALVLSLMACGVGANDEVITVSNTFIATVAAIEAVGATPVLVDVDESRNMDCAALSDAVTKKTKAVIPVHLAGIPCDMDKIGKIARQSGITVIEDAAQAFGSKYRGTWVGRFGMCGCFSLHPTKVLGGCGDGGFILTDCDEIYDQLMLFRNHGLKNREDVMRFGSNSRLDEIQACFLNYRLESINSEIKRRATIADRYSDAFCSLPIKLPVCPPGSEVSYFTYTIMCEKRDELKDYLSKHHVDARIHYPVPIHLQPAYLNKYQPMSLPVAERQAGQILSLPCNGGMTDDEVETVIDLIRRWYAV